MIEENLRSREQVAQSTTEFLTRQLEEKKKDLDDQDSKLATFKRQYMGQLPGDVDNNLKLLMAMNSQLDANTQSLNRAQQDKAYTESLLAQQLTTWKSTQSSTNPQTLEQQLTRVAGSVVAIAESLHGRSPRRYQDEKRHRRSEEEIGGSELCLGCRARR